MREETRGQHPALLPGAEQAERLLDPTLPSNTLIP